MPAPPTAMIMNARKRKLANRQKEQVLWTSEMRLCRDERQKGKTWLSYRSDDGRIRRSIKHYFWESYFRDRHCATLLEAVEGA